LKRKSSEPGEKLRDAAQHLSCTSSSKTLLQVIMRSLINCFDDEYEHEYEHEDKTKCEQLYHSTQVQQELDKEDVLGITCSSFFRFLFIISSSHCMNQRIVYTRETRERILILFFSQDVHPSLSFLFLPETALLFRYIIFSRVSQGFELESLLQQGFLERKID